MSRSGTDYLQLFFEEFPDWLACVIDTGGLGLCEEMSLDLHTRFPELIRVYGDVELLGGINREHPPGATLRPELMEVQIPYEMLHFERTRWPHWWCQTESGQVIDPSRWQFPGEVRYHRLDTHPDGPPTGKCPDCGGYARQHRTFCSDACERSFADYINGRSSNE